MPTSINLTENNYIKQDLLQKDITEQEIELTNFYNLSTSIKAQIVEIETKIKQKEQELGQKTAQINSILTSTAPPTPQQLDILFTQQENIQRTIKDLKKEHNTLLLQYQNIQEKIVAQKDLIIADRKQLLQQNIDLMKHEKQKIEEEEKAAIARSILYTIYTTLIPTQQTADFNIFFYFLDCYKLKTKYFLIPFNKIKSNILSYKINPAQLDPTLPDQSLLPFLLEQIVENQMQNFSLLNLKILQPARKALCYTIRKLTEIVINEAYPKKLIENYLKSQFLIDTNINALLSSKPIIQNSIEIANIYIKGEKTTNSAQAIEKLKKEVNDFVKKTSKTNFTPDLAQHLNNIIEVKITASSTKETISLRGMLAFFWFKLFEEQF